VFEVRCVCGVLRLPNMPCCVQREVVVHHHPPPSTVHHFTGMLFHHASAHRQVSRQVSQTTRPPCACARHARVRCVLRVEAAV